MKLLLLSDIHKMLHSPRSRLDNVHIAQDRKINYINSYAEKNDCSYTLQAGDLNDKSRNWFLQAYWQVFLSHKSHTKWLTVFGQHCTYMYSEETRHATIMGSLASTNLLTVLDDRGFKAGDGVVIYGCSYGQEVPKPKSKNDLNILVIHKMIVDKALWSGQEDFVYAPTFLKQHRGYDLILCGDCHQKFLFEDKGRYIVNTGCMTRIIARQYNFSHSPGFYIYDTETRKIEWHEIPHEPAEEVLTREHIEREEEVNAMLGDFIEAVKQGDDSEGMSFMDNLAVLVKSEEVGERVREIITNTIDEELK